MNLEDFQLLDKEPIDNNIVNRDFLKVYHQHGAQLKDPNQKFEFIFGEDNNYHQSRDSFLDFHISVRDPTAGFNNNAEIRLVINAFAFCFTEATIATTGGMEIEHVKFLGQVSTIMRSLTSKDGDLLSYFDKINDTDKNSSMNIDSLNDSLNNSHSVAGNRGKKKGNWHWNMYSVFVKLLRRLLKI